MGAAEGIQNLNHSGQQLLHLLRRLKTPIYCNNPQGLVRAGF